MALLIDAICFLPVAVALAASQAGIQVGRGFFRFELIGISLVVLVAAFMLAMTAMEAMAGASIGKLCTGLRVRRMDGQLLTVGQAAVRNLLRLVDGFPFLVPYLVGAITAWSTPRRQRVGDLLAGTVVVSIHRTRKGPSPPGGAFPAQRPASRRIWGGVVVTTLVVTSTLVFAWLQGRCTIEAGRYDCQGVSFDYPPSWRPLHDVARAGQGVPMFQARIGLDPYSHVGIEAFRLPPGITDLNHELLLPGIRRFTDQLAAYLDGRVVVEPTPASAGGLPGYRMSIEGAVDGRPLDLQGTFLFHGWRQYWIGCQWSGPTEDDIRSGCARILETFQSEI